MKLNPQRFGPELRQRLKTGFLMLAGLAGLYLSLRPLQRAREFRNQQATGLGAVRPQSIPEFISTKLARRARVDDGVASIYFQAGADAVQESALMSPSRLPEDERKLVRTSSLDLVVKDPAAAAEKVRQLAEHNGGYLVSSRIQGSEGNASAALTIRVPVTLFEEVRAGIRKLALRVESDRLEAQDVTKDYVDREARLRNLHAQEQPYLQILKRAATVKDTLEVSEKLNEIRGQIEQQQAEFEALAKQVETVAIAVELRGDADAQVLGLRWRPLYRIKAALRDGLVGLGDYIATMTSFVFLLPTVLLWLMTLVLGAAVAWRLLRWVARAFFNFPKPAKAVS